MEKMFNLRLLLDLKAPDFGSVGQNMEAVQNMFWNATKFSDK